MSDESSGLVTLRSAIESLIDQYETNAMELAALAQKLRIQADEKEKQSAVLHEAVAGMRAALPKYGQGQANER